jgi:hypothetical protein
MVVDDVRSSVDAGWSLADPADSSEWSVVAAENNVVGEELLESEEWSMLSRDGEIILDTPKRVTPISSPRQQGRGEDEEDFDQDSSCSDEEDCCCCDLHFGGNTARTGKKALKHLLVKRVHPHDNPGSDMHGDDHIEVTQRGKDGDGLSPKTPVDDMLPELLTKWCATLGVLIDGKA